MPKIIQKMTIILSAIEILQVMKRILKVIVPVVLVKCFQVYLPFLVAVGFLVRK